MDSLEIQNSSGEFGCDSDPDDTAAESPGPSNTRRRGSLKRKSLYRKWSAGERAAVLRHLEHYIDADKLPGRGAIEACIKAEPALKNRSWVLIKNFCRNSVKRKQMVLDKTW